MTLLLLRRNRRAFSSFYGAMGVLLVSSAIVGLLLLPREGANTDEPRERHLADLYLDALLHSTVAEGTTLSQALANACFALHCQRGAWNISELKSVIDPLAAPLAKALERSYAVAVTADGLAKFRVGNLPADSKGAPATAEVFRPVDGTFVGISVLLASP